MPVIILFISGLLALLLFLHWVVYATIVFFLQLKPAWLLWAMLAMPAGFILASIIGSRFNNWLTSIFYYLTSAWLGLFNFLALAAVLIWLLYGASRLFRFTLPWPALAAVLFGLAIAAFIYGLVNASYVRLKTYEVSIANLPVSWQGRTAVWVSDLHLGQIHKAGFAQQVVDKIKTVKPDIVFVGGDLFDGTAGDVSRLATPFRELRPPLGTFFITGNHEEFTSPDHYLKVVRDLGMRPLSDEAVLVDGLMIIGVNFRDGANPDRFKKVVALIGIELKREQSTNRFQAAFAGIADKSQPIILLNHFPGNLELAQAAGVNLQLSGHTHRGQLWPYNYITKLVYQGYDYGQKLYQDMTVITSAGAGTWGPPLRLAADPDITVIKFK